MATGIVKEVYSSKNYGFLFPLGAKRDTPLIYFHFSQLVGMQSVPLGAEVRFTKVRSDHESGVQAAHIELLELGGQRTLREAEQERNRNERQGSHRTSEVFQIKKAS